MAGSNLAPAERRRYEGQFLNTNYRKVRLTSGTAGDLMAVFRVTWSFRAKRGG